jgi:predicted RNA-binding protein
MTRHWLCVTISHNWEIVKRVNVWGVNDRYKITLKRYVSLGDALIFYARSV